MVKIWIIIVLTQLINLQIQGVFVGPHFSIRHYEPELI
jgi:hypothetical protein